MADEQIRLSRIESKIDELSKAFIILARTEEKLLVIERDRLDMKERLSKIEQSTEEGNKILSERLASMSAEITNSTQVTDIIRRIFWLLAAGMTGAFAVNYFK